MDGPRLDPPVLELERFGVRIRDRVILAEVDLSVPPRCVLALLGPAGGGKSTLLRALSGLHDGQPEVVQWGQARYDGGPLGPSRRPWLVQQELRHFVSTVLENLASALPDRQRLQRGQQIERIKAFLDAMGAAELFGRLDEEVVRLEAPLQRVLSVLRAMLSGQALLCLDETTANLPTESADRILGLMRRYAAERSILFVTHHQQHARAVADHCALLAGGRVQEAASCAEFFAAPSMDVTRHFLATGGSALPAPDASPETLAEDAPVPPPLHPAAKVMPASCGPRGFRWLLPGRLGGAPRPGIVAELDADLEALARLGVDVLVTLEEVATVPPEALRGRSIELLHVPVVDMQAPPPDAAARLCGEIAARLERGRVVVYHCRAGQGRTGTLLACQLIWSGASAVEALDRVRSANPQWVTSAAQVRFLDEFFEHVRRARGHGAEQSTLPEWS